MLNTEISGLRMKNPLILASGILDEVGSTMSEIGKQAGALVTKSIGMEPREGYGNPAVIPMEHGILNAVGLANPGIDEFGEEIAEAKKGGAPVIGSVFSDDYEGFGYLAGRMEDYGADAVELNLSCPHAKGYGLEVGSSPEGVKKAVESALSSVKIPIFAKLTPNTHDISALALAAHEAGASGVVAINTVKGMAINIDAGMPVLANKVGGYSGPAIKPIGLRLVYEIYPAFEREGARIPIIGVGGITTGTDAIEYMMAGASALQVGSAFHYRGKDTMKLIAEEMEAFLKEKGYGSIKEVVGLAHL